MNENQARVIVLETITSRRLTIDVACSNVLLSLFKIRKGWSIVDSRPHVILTPEFGQVGERLECRVVSISQSKNLQAVLLDVEGTSIGCVVSVGAGGRVRDVDSITEWEVIEMEFNVSGVIEEEERLGIVKKVKEEVVAVLVGGRKISTLVMEVWPGLKGRELGEVLSEVGEFVKVNECEDLESVVKFISGLNLGKLFN
jgi:hypothetical protein